MGCFENMLLYDPLAAPAHAPLTDMYERSDHYYTEGCQVSPGKALELNFADLARRNDTVESGRAKLRGHILIA